MSGSKSSYPAGGAETLPAGADTPLTLTVYDMPQLGQDEARQAALTRSGRWKMLAVLAVCAAPVIASYFTYYVVRPEGRRNYGELIEPQRPMPDLVATDSEGQEVRLSTLKRQWLYVSVADSACDDTCQRNLYVQRQVREGLGKDKDRVVWVWLRTGGKDLSDVLRRGTAAATVLHVDEQVLAQWLQPAPGHQLSEHLYVVDPMGNWMMRFPANADPTRMRKDLEVLLRASSSWNRGSGD